MRVAATASGQFDVTSLTRRRQLVTQHMSPAAVPSCQSA